jgi:hypothetical protein
MRKARAALAVSWRWPSREFRTLRLSPKPLDYSGSLGETGFALAHRPRRNASLIAKLAGETPALPGRLKACNMIAWAEASQRARLRKMPQLSY